MISFSLHPSFYYSVLVGVQQLQFLIQAVVVIEIILDPFITITKDPLLNQNEIPVAQEIQGFSEGILPKEVFYAIPTVNALQLQFVLSLSHPITG